MKRLIFSILLTALCSTAAAREMYIPISGYAEGAKGTFFRTDVRIFNPESRPIAISLHFLPANMNGSNIPGRIVNLEPREMLVLNNIVGDFFEMPAPSLGAIWLDSWHGEVDYEFTADSRTYTDSPATGVGTYGQFIPAFEKLSAKKKVVVLHLSNDGSGGGGYRSNIGLMNPAFEDATVTTSLHRADGTTIGSAAEWNVPANSVIQHPVAAMADLETVDFADGYLVVESSLPVFAYGSVVDNITADQVFVSGVEDIVLGGDIDLTPDCASAAPLYRTDYAAEGWIVIYNDGVNAINETAALAEAHEFTPSYIYSGGGLEGFSADLTAEEIAALRCESSVRYIQQNARGRI